MTTQETPTKTVQTTVQSVGLYNGSWKLETTPEPGRDYPEQYYDQKEDIFSGLRPGQLVTLYLKRGNIKHRKDKTDYDGSKDWMYFWNVVKVVQGHAVPPGGTPQPTPVPAPQAAPKPTQATAQAQPAPAQAPSVPPPTPQAEEREYWERKQMLERRSIERQVALRCASAEVAAQVSANYPFATPPQETVLYWAKAYMRLLELGPLADPIAAKTIADVEAAFGGRQEGE